MSEACIIIPCYNEENRLDRSSFIAFLEKYNQYHLLFVNDGSKDKTLQVLQNIKAKFPQKVDILNLKENSGKAEAVRKGILEAFNRKYEYLGYLDADLATPLEEFHLMYGLMKEKNAIMVMGSRVQRLGARINRSFLRHILGRIFATIVSKMLDLPVYDTQCGAKILKARVTPTIFENTFLSKWLFDVELLFRLKNHGFTKQNDIFEFPLHSWEERGDSRIKVSDVIQFPIELMKIYFKYKK